VNDVFESPVFPVLIRLEDEGFRFRLKADGTVQVAPVSRVPANAKALLRRHEADVRVLVAIGTDDGVHARRDRFREQLARGAGAKFPALTYKVDVAYERGTCFSCHDLLESSSRVGRCWRCRLAWRLVAGASIAAHDGPVSRAA
jgi:hypothetical protein